MKILVREIYEFYNAFAVIYPPFSLIPQIELFVLHIFHIFNLVSASGRKFYALNCVAFLFYFNNARLTKYS